MGSQAEDRRVPRFIGMRVRGEQEMSFVVSGKDSVGKGDKISLGN